MNGKNMTEDTKVGQTSEQIMRAHGEPGERFVTHLHMGQLKALLLKQLNADMSNKLVFFLKIILPCIFYPLFGMGTVFNSVPSLEVINTQDFFDVISPAEQINLTNVTFDAANSFTVFYGAKNDDVYLTMLDSFSPGFSVQPIGFTAPISQVPVPPLSGSLGNDTRRLTDSNTEFQEEVSFYFIVGQAQNGSDAPENIMGVFFREMSAAKTVYTIFIKDSESITFSSDPGDHIVSSDVLNTTTFAGNPLLKNGIYQLQRYVDATVLSNFYGIPLTIDDYLAQVSAIKFKKAVVDLSFDEGFALWTIALNLMMAISFLFTAYLGTTVFEKKEAIYRSYLLVGVPKWVYFLHWWIYFVVMGFVTSLLLTGIFFAVQLYQYSNYFLVFLWVFLGIAGSIGVVLFMSSLVSAVNTASIFTFFGSILIALVYIPIVTQNSPFALRSILTLVFPLFGFLQGMLLFYENDYAFLRPGVTFENAGELKLGYLYMAQLGSIIIWTNLGLFYRPGERNSMSFRKWIFRSSHAGNLTKISHPQPADLEVHNGETFVKVSNLVKTYPGADFNAVDGITVSLGKGEVYGLIGHNGSGKTTFSSMLSGELEPTEGSVSYRFDETREPVMLNEKHRDMIKAKVGVCTQENLLNPGLTGRQHLELFGKLKGFSPAAAKREAQRLFNLLSIANKGVAEVKQDKDLLVEKEDLSFADKLVKNFSGGMKRKLTILISLIGDPELLILDEPTAGIDVGTKEIIHQIVKEVKRNRCILLTTHFMEEADLLADQIIVLNKGKIMSKGTSLSLKHSLGTGYTVQFKLPENSGSNGLALVDEEIIKLVPEAFQLEFTSKNKYITSSAQSKAGPEASDNLYRYRLGYAEKSIPMLLSMLNQLKCKEIHVQLTTLEEVFMKIGAETSAEAEDVEPAIAREISNQSETLPNLTSTKIVQDEGFLSQVGKISVLGNNIMLNDLKDPSFFMFGIILPLALLIAAFIVSSTADKTSTTNSTTTDNLSASGLQSLDLTTSLALDDKTGLMSFDTFDLGDLVTCVSLQDTVSTVFDPETDVDDPLDASKIYIGGEKDGKLFFNPTVDVSLLLTENVISNLILAANRVNDNCNFLPNETMLPVISSSLIKTIGSNDFLFEFNIVNLLVPMFLNMALLALAYCLLTILDLKERGLIHYFNILGVTKIEVYVAVAYSRIVFALVPTLIISIVLGLIVKSPVMGDNYRWLVFIALIVIYTFAVLPLGMLLEVLFPTRLAATVYPYFWQIINIVPYVLFFVLRSQDDEDLQRSADTVQKIFVYFPGFAAQLALFNLLIFSTVSDEVEKQFPGQVDQQDKRDILYGDDTHIVEALYTMAYMGLVFWILLYIRHSRREGFFRALYKSFAKQESSSTTVDEFLVVDHINKKYKAQSKKASKATIRDDGSPNGNLKEGYVIANDDITFKADRGEVYVLIGKTGAGKTVCMKAIIGDIIPDSGSIYIDQIRLTERTLPKMFQKGYFGYCPQFDVYFEHLKVREQLDFIAKMRGFRLPKNFFKEIRNTFSTEDKEAFVSNIKSIPAKELALLIFTLNYQPHVNKLIDQLSGGLKRKLSMVMSIMGGPDLRIMDEPSTGLDPLAKKTLWDIVKQTTSVDQSSTDKPPCILLSTHDMQEAEALADRVGIISNGKLITQGTVGELIAEHCSFIQVEVVFNTIDEAKHQTQQSVLDAITSAFNSSSLEITDRSLSKIRFRVPHDKSISVSKQMSTIFHQMEGLKEAGKFDYYEVSQMNLEQIFLQMTKED